MLVVLNRLIVSSGASWTKRVIFYCMLSRHNKAGAAWFMMLAASTTLKSSSLRRNHQRASFLLATMTVSWTSKLHCFCRKWMEFLPSMASTNEHLTSKQDTLLDLNTSTDLPLEGRMTKNEVLSWFQLVNLEIYHILLVLRECLCRFYAPCYFWGG